VTHQLGTKTSEPRLLRKWRTRTEDCELPAEEPKDICQITDDDNELNKDDEFDWSLNEPVIKSSSEALKVVERLAEFAQFRGLEELSNAIFM
jgi:hypothetical protein